MTNRKKIERFCKNNYVRLVSCKLERYTTVVPEYKLSIVEYHVEIDVDGKILRYESGEMSGDNTSDDVEAMLVHMQEDIDETRYE